MYSSPFFRGAACLAALALAFGGAALGGDFDPSTGTISDARWKSGVPLGGIGVGKIELMTDASFGNFTNQNNWDRPYLWARGAFAAVRTQTESGAVVARLLRGPSPHEYSGVTNIAHTRMQGWFPRGEVEFVDAGLPIAVRLDAFSPLIPHDVKDSSLPVACLSYTMTNPGKQAVRASILLAWPNLLGWGGRPKNMFFAPAGQIWEDLRCDTQAPADAGALRGLRFTTQQSYPHQQQQNVVGEDFVGVRQEAGVEVSTCPTWDAGAATPAFWQEFTSTGQLQPIAWAVAGKSPGAVQPAGAVAAQVMLGAGQTRTLRFYVVWAMPHLVTVRRRTVYGPDTTSPGKDLGAMFDGKAATRWTTGRVAQPGDNMVLDLGKTCTPTGITLDSGAEGTDVPRGLRVEISADAKAWRPAAEVGTEAIQGGSQEIPLTPHLGRYLRLTNLGTDQTHWWSIYTLDIHVKEQAGPLALTAAAATPHLLAAHLLDGEREDAGHFWENWWHNASEIAAYVDQNADAFLGGTRAWQTPVMNSDLPFWLKLKLINCAFPVVSNTILTRDGRFSVLESPIDMSGALGTMDQRMAAHAFYTAFFPELDRAELELFADCQQPDGRITHFVGNVHEVIGKPDVYYGITDWPDLSSAWVMQVVKLYRWTGDEAFLGRMRMHIFKAMDWLDRDGRNDEHIPVGGSTYDYEKVPTGAFIYSASCYLGALRAAAAVDGPGGAQVYDQRLSVTQHSVMTLLWNGTFFRKWKQPGGGRSVGASFVANLAGDWLARLSGLPRTLDPGIIDRAIAQTIARHQLPFDPVPPMQVTAHGKESPGYSFFLQHEPYLGCEAIYENFTSDGLETLRRVYRCAWEINHSPWNQSLVYASPRGAQSGLKSYMTCPTSWFVLNALGGTSLDLPHGRLFISPRLATGRTELHIPVFFSRFWGWLDYVPARHHLSLRIDKVFAPDRAAEKMLYHAPGPGPGSAPAPGSGPGTAPGSAGATGEALPDAITVTSVAADGDAVPIELPEAFQVRAGATLDLSALLGRLNVPAKGETVTLPPHGTAHD